MRDEAERADVVVDAVSSVEEGESDSCPGSLWGPPARFANGGAGDSSPPAARVQIQVRADLMRALLARAAAQLGSQVGPLEPTRPTIPRVQRQPPRPREQQERRLVAADEAASAAAAAEALSAAAGGDAQDAPNFQLDPPGGVKG